MMGSTIGWLEEVSWLVHKLSKWLLCVFEELTRKIADMVANQLKARRKAQALEGIALLVEAAKDLYSLLR